MKDEDLLSPYPPSTSHKPLGVAAEPSLVCGSWTTVGVRLPSGRPVPSWPLAPLPNAQSWPDESKMRVWCLRNMILWMNSMNLLQSPPWHHLPLCSSPAAGAHLLWPTLVVNFTVKFSFKLDQELRYNRQNPQDEAPKYFSYFFIFANPHALKLLVLWETGHKSSCLVNLLLVDYRNLHPWCLLLILLLSRSAVHIKHCTMC